VDDESPPFPPDSEQKNGLTEKTYDEVLTNPTGGHEDAGW
jgi:hypothetical protein